MKSLYNFLLVLFFCLGITAQGFAQSVPFECGTVIGEQNVGALMSTLSTPVYSGSYDLEYLETFPPISFNIHFWIINRTNGSGDFPISLQDIQENVDIINEMYKPMGICFVLNGYGNINNTNIYANASFSAITNYAGQNGYVVPNCFNVYLPRTLSAGNGVTYFGSDKLAVLQAGILGTFGAVRGNVLAHELAHDFGLPHPWGLANATTVTAEHVTRDPSDPYYNALTTADNIHDTPAMVSFWTEANENGVTISDIINTTSCEYLGNHTDDIGVPFLLTPTDVGNTMGYTWETCVKGFTVGQGIRIREYISANPGSASVKAMINNVCNNCSDNLIISEPVVISESFKVVNTITATSAINNDIQVIYSGDQILLEPGFETGTETTSFLARVEPCSLTGNRQSIATMNSKSNAENKIADGKTMDNLFYMTPNPANSFITIDSPQEIKSIIITSLDGKVLYQNSPQSKPISTNVAIDGYVNGVYNVSITTVDGKKQSQKLIKN